MRASVFAIYSVVLGLLLSAPRIVVCQDSNAGSKLQVNLNYSGTGTVDEKHKIYVVLWDSPDFVKSEMRPFAVQPASSKNGVVKFEDVKKMPVYVSAAYDPSGQWNAQSPPPDGSSLGLYSKNPGQPDPVDFKPGKTITIELAFDDSVKMKGGKATRQ